MQNLKIGIIGCGGAGNLHAEGYHKIDGINIAAVSDIDFEKAKALGEVYGAKAYNSYADMIIDQKPDVVSICTREYDHTEPAIFALRHNSHVFCEKMMSSNLEEAKQMVAEAELNHKILGVNYNYRYIDSIQALKKKISSGELGEMRHMVLQVHAYCHHHAIDLVRYLIGDPDELISILIEDEKERHYQWYDADKLLYIPSVGETTVFKKNSTLISVSACHYSFDYPLMEIDCIGTKGRAKLTGMSIDNINGNLSFQHGRERSHEAEKESLELRNTFHRAVTGFIGYVRGQKGLAANGNDGLKAMEIEKAISYSYGDRKYIKLL